MKEKLLSFNLALFGAGDVVNSTVCYVNSKTDAVTNFGEGSSLEG